MTMALWVSLGFDDEIFMTSSILLKYNILLLEDLIALPLYCYIFTFGVQVMLLSWSN